MTWRSWRSIGTVTIVLAAPACSGESPTTGALGHTTASAACAPSDQACAFAGLDAPLAVGAKLPLSVDVTAKGFSAPPLTLASANVRVFDVQGHTAIGKAPGFASLLVFTPETLVIDFVTLSVEKPTELRVHRMTKDGAVEALPMPTKIQLLVGDDVSFSVRPYFGERHLLGDIDATWSADDALVKLVDSGTPAGHRVVARSSGTTTLHAAALGLEAKLTLEVLQ